MRAGRRGQEERRAPSLALEQACLGRGERPRQQLDLVLWDAGSGSHSLAFRERRRPDDQRWEGGWLHLLIQQD